MQPPSAPSPSQDPRSFPAIDMLRGFAALLVLMYHVLIFGNWQNTAQGGLWVLWGRGFTGVDLFLVISGFVIARTALHGHATQGSAFRAGFARRRFWRIAPLYYLTTLVFVVIIQPGLMLVPWHVLAAHLGTHVFFVHNLYSETHGSINGVSWSVALEMQFYLLMLLATPWIARAHAWRTLLMVAVFALGYRYLTTLIWPPGKAPPIVQFIYASQLPGVIDQFACGILLALTLHRQQGMLLRHLQVGWINFTAWILISLPFLLVAIFLERNFRYWELASMILGWRVLATLGFTALLAAALVFPWAALWPFAPLRYFGQISYGVYLWHMPVIVTLNSRLPELSGYRFLGCVMAGSVALAAFTWHWFERPCIERGGLKNPAAVG